MHRAALLLAALLSLTGCAGKPTTYLTLSQSPPASTESVNAGGPLAVSHVQIPPDMDRTQLTTATGPGTLNVAGKTRWAGPLDGLTQIVLARDLAARLPAMTVLMPGDPVPAAGARQIRVNIQSFMPDQNGRVTLVADWSVMAADGQTILLHGRFQDTLAGAPQPSAEAQTMSAAIGRLADRIAAALQDARTA